MLNENADELNDVNRHNFKIHGTYDLKIDSANSLRITANTNFYHTESNNERNSITTGANGNLKNTSNRNLFTNNDKNALSGNIIFKHKFNKLRRTLSFSGNWNTMSTQGNSLLKSFNQSYFDGVPSGSQDLDQMRDYDMSTQNLSAKLTYTEPLGKEYALELAYQLSYNYGTNDQQTYTYSPVSNKYDFVVDSLSNQFRQTIIQNIPSMRLNFNNKKFKANIGSGFGFTDFNLKDITYDKDYKRNYVNFFPNANITYTYKPNRNIRLYYNGNTTQPTVNQLQPLRNNNDYFNQYIGNPDLKPSFTNQFSVSHNSYNFLKDVFMYQSFNIRLTENSITNNRIINVDSGKTVTQPINTSGNISMNLYSGFGGKIKKLDMRYNVGPSFQYNKYADVINSKKSFSTTIGPGVNLWLNKSKEKKYDVGIQNQFSYNENTTTQNDTKIHYISNQLSFYGTIYIKKVWSITTDYNYYYRQKTLQFNDKIDNHILNERLQRTFKNDEFTVYFIIRDILNQNIGIERNFYGNTYSEVINDRLKRYFMVGFTWNFKNKSKGAAPTPEK